MGCNNDYSYSIELYDDDGRSLGSAPVDIDWEPAVESARFEAIRARRFPAAGGPFDARIVPRWSAELGRPFLGGFRVEVSSPGVDPAGRDFGLAYFAALATAASERHVAEGRLSAGDSFRFAIAAFDIDPAAAARTDICGPTPLAFREARLAGLAAGSVLRGPTVATDPALFVPQNLLDEASAQARHAGACETGGILIGDLYRDPGGEGVFSVVEALIPATRARGELTRLTFNPETWAEVHTIVNLRGRDETMLGWYHSHPAYAWNCKNCPVEQRRRCPLASDFLSAEDRALHRAVFPRAYSVALVVNLITADEHKYSLFSWRDGLLVPRGFNVTAPAVHAAPRSRPVAGGRAESIEPAREGA